MFVTFTGLAIASLILAICIRRIQQHDVKSITNEILLAISVSVIGSYFIFYFNIYYPQQQQQKHDAVFIGQAISEIRAHALMQHALITSNIKMEKLSNPKVSSTNIRSLSSYHMRSIETEYTLLGYYQCIIAMTSSSRLRPLFALHLAGAFKPTILDTFNGNELLLHYEAMNRSIEHIIYNLILLKDQDSYFATEVLKNIDKKLSGFEHTLQYSQQNVFLGLLPLEEIKKLEQAWKNNQQTFYPIK